jgi:hypothetical protein
MAGSGVRLSLRTQRGQAMTEFYVVLLGFLLPMMAILFLYAQVASVRQDAETAVRYSVWQRTVWKGTTAEIDPNFQASESALAPTTVKSDDDIAREVDSRVFASGDSAIYTTTTGSTAITLKPFNNTMWTAQPGTLTPLISQRSGSAPTDPRYSTQGSSDSALSGTEGNLINTAINGHFSGLRFALNTKGLIQAKVNFSLIQIPDGVLPSNVLPAPNISMSRTLSIYTDGWTPGGRNDDRYRSAGLLKQELDLDNPTIHGEQNKFSPTIAKIVRCNTYESDCYLDPGYENIDAVPSERLTN